MSIDSLLQKEQIAINSIHTALLAAYNSNYKLYEHPHRTQNISASRKETPLLQGQQLLLRNAIYMFLTSMDQLYFTYDRTCGRSYTCDFMRKWGEIRWKTLKQKGNSDAPSLFYCDTVSSYFKYIPQLLNIDTPEVLQLLPYLMTAYTCQAINNSRKLYNRILELSFGKIDPTRVSDDNPDRRRKQIEKMCHAFSLEGYTVTPEEPSVSARPDRPVPSAIPHDSLPEVFHNAAFVEHIFALWCDCLLRTAYPSWKTDAHEPEAKIPPPTPPYNMRVRKKIARMSAQKAQYVKNVFDRIDFKGSYQLFLEQTDQAVPERFTTALQDSSDACRSVLLSDFQGASMLTYI